MVVEECCNIFGISFLEVILDVYFCMYAVVVVVVAAVFIPDIQVFYKISIILFPRVVM